MTAKDIISPIRRNDDRRAETTVAADTHIVDVLHQLLGNDRRLLNVTDNDINIGIIDSDSLLEGLGRLIAPRDDSSMIIVECAPEDYSASLLSHAVEDADTHLVDLFSSPAENGQLRVTLRVRTTDPSPVVKSLERYDFTVVDVYGHDNMQNLQVAEERLKALQMILNI